MRQFTHVFLPLVVMSVLAGLATAQGPTVQPHRFEVPGRSDSRLGPDLGAAGGLFGDDGTASGGQVIGGRAGVSAPRIFPRGTMRQGAPTLEPAQIGLPDPLEVEDVQDFGSLDFPSLRSDLGPENGLTLDQAIELLVHNNMELRSQYFEIPQSQADILTASLRANPILYADSQLIPYGNYSEQRPGGPVQYDLNITYPLDLSRKRQARTQVAARAKQVLEAEFQNAVRLQIDNLYTAYVAVLAARQRALFATAATKSLDAMLQPMGDQLKVGRITRAEYNRVLLQRETAALAANDANEALAIAGRNLGQLLNLPANASIATVVRGSLYDRGMEVPDATHLVDLALQQRPDLTAFRLAVMRAHAEERLALANRLDDVFLLYQPYTYQRNTVPEGAMATTSWAVGLTVPLPIFNRNQGNIQRARLNICQTRAEYQDLTRRVIDEVNAADREYRLTLAAMHRFEEVLRPAAEEVLATAQRQFDQGSIDLIGYLNTRRDYNQVARQYLDTLVRHRRAMLSLNTAVGQRLLP